MLHCTRGPVLVALAVVIFVGLLSGPASAQAMGDAVFRSLMWQSDSYFNWGHAGVVDGSNVIEMDRDAGGIRRIPLATFQCTTTYWGRYHLGQGAVQATRILAAARTQLELRVRYSLVLYKSPGRSFRCDGLLEYCYEQAGLDIIPWYAGDKAHQLRPARQLRAMVRR